VIRGAEEPSESLAVVVRELQSVGVGHSKDALSLDVIVSGFFGQ
jgi:hypothetical protein